MLPVNIDKFEISIEFGVHTAVGAIILKTGAVSTVTSIMSISLHPLAPVYM